MSGAHLPGARRTGERGTLEAGNGVQFLRVLIGNAVVLMLMGEVLGVMETVLMVMGMVR